MERVSKLHIRSVRSAPGSNSGSLPPRQSQILRICKGNLVLGNLGNLIFLDFTPELHIRSIRSERIECRVSKLHIRSIRSRACNIELIEITYSIDSIGTNGSNIEFRQLGIVETKGSIRNFTYLDPRNYIFDQFDRNEYRISISKLHIEITSSTSIEFRYIEITSGLSEQIEYRISIPVNSIQSIEYRMDRNYIFDQFDRTMDRISNIEFRSIRSIRSIRSVR